MLSALNQNDKNNFQLEKVPESVSSLFEENPENYFEVVEFLGEGNFGTIVKARVKNTDEYMAIKIIPIKENQYQKIKEILQPILEISSPYLVKYHGIYYKDNNMWLSMDLCEMGSIGDLLKISEKSLSEKEIATILQYILQGIIELHNNDIFHLELKGNNILFDINGIPKLTDYFLIYNLIREKGENKLPYQHSPFWTEPDILKNIDDISEKSDIWSLGITAIELADRFPPYSELDSISAINKIKQKPKTMLSKPERFSFEFLDFIKSCLILNRKNRSDAQKLLQHSFILKNTQSIDTIKNMLMKQMELFQNGDDEDEEDDMTGIYDSEQIHSKKNFESRKIPPLNSRIQGGQLPLVVDHQILEKDQCLEMEESKLTLSKLPVDMTLSVKTQLTDQNSNLQQVFSQNRQTNSLKDIQNPENQKKKQQNLSLKDEQKLKLEEKQNNKDDNKIYESANKIDQKKYSEESNSKKQKPKIKIKQDIPKSFQDYDKKNQTEDYDDYTLEQLENKLNRLQQDMDYEIQIIQEMYQNKISKCTAAIQKLKNPNTSKQQCTNEVESIYSESQSESYNNSLNPSQKFEIDECVVYDNGEVDNQEAKPQITESQKQTPRDQAVVVSPIGSGGSGGSNGSGGQRSEGLNLSGGGVASKRQEEEKQVILPNKTQKQSSEQICKKIAKLPFNFQVDAQFLQQVTNIAQQDTKKNKSLPFEFAPHLHKQPPSKPNPPQTKSLPFSFQPLG